MKRILRLFVLASFYRSILASCTTTECYGLQNCYHDCENLTDLQMISHLPTGVIGISIKNSNITNIPTDAFSVQGGSLEELNITGCGVEEIEPNAFRGLDRLRVLSLVDNKIRKLDSLWIQDLSNLKALIVWRNRITEVDARLYDLLPNLEFWDIAHNEMSACLPTELLKKLTKLRKIYLASNPWSYRCRRSMTWYLGTSHIHFVQDWGTSDLLIEECLAHEPNAEVDDNALYKCVDRKVGSTEMLQTVAGLTEQIRELSRKVTELETEVTALKNTAGLTLNYNFHG